MDRRSALSLLSMAMLSACGGGGGGPAVAETAGDTVPVAPPASAPPGAAPTAAAPAQPSDTQPSDTPVQPVVQPVAALSRNIAVWGDSLTNLYAGNMQAAVPDRQVYNGGVSGETSTQTMLRAVADQDHRDWISVYWYGHNDYTKAAVAGNIAASIAALAPNNKAFIVMSMLNWADNGERGTDVYADIMNVNGQLAAQYPDNFIDIHEYLVSLYRPDDPQDVQDYLNDLVPTSLRYDRIHLNPTGCDRVAAKIKDFITAKGW